ncbi:DUF5644 domain-containing protein [Helicobacter sp. 23-1044]
MRFEISVFRFDAKFDYNEHYERVKIDIDESLSLKDLMKEVEKTLENFTYDKESFGFRINGKAIFSNVKLAEIYAHFGANLAIDSLCQKYALKDLLINKDEVFALYAPQLEKFTFLNAESKSEFKKYILINLISPLDLRDYVGDGWALFVKWMALHYQDNATELFESIFDFERGIINHIATKDLIYPPDKSIDDEIESLQRELFSANLPYIAKLKKANAQKYSIIKDI